MWEKPPKDLELWRERVRQQGCCYHLSECSDETEIHHIAGRTAKFAGHPVGHVLILPLCNAGHRTVERMPKDEQKAMFLEVCFRERKYGELPFSADVLCAALSWRR